MTSVELIADYGNAELRDRLSRANLPAYWDIEVLIKNRDEEEYARVITYALRMDGM